MRYEIHMTPLPDSKAAKWAVNFMVVEADTGSRVAFCATEPNAQLICRALNNYAVLAERVTVMETQVADIKRTLRIA